MLLYLCVSEIFFYTFLKLKVIVSVGLIIYSGEIWCIWNGMAILLFQNNLKNKEHLKALCSS